tara:strand:- start:131 stop:1144 length:1014 start_codon:yes stop_codon:yes gene_type:complete
MISMVTDIKKWQKVLSEVDTYDFYHTYEYHIIAKKQDETPLLFLYTHKRIIVALPLLRRAIKGTPYFDLTSVYGYAGPLSKNVDHDYDNDHFIKEFKEMLGVLKITTIFSRLHPYIPFQQQVLKNLGNTPVLGKVVNIDLGLPLELQKRQYSKSTRNRVNKCRRCCTVTNGSTEEDIHTFMSIYKENMDRVSASKEYYFAKKYYLDLLHSTAFKTTMLLLHHAETQESMAAALFIQTNEMVQFHLSGTRTKFLKLAPANLFLDEMRLKATEEGYRYFNLGGGLGAKEDALFSFKASFSKDHKDFRVWQYIVDQPVYNVLSRKKQTRSKNDYFPLYRG